MLEMFFQFPVFFEQPSYLILIIFQYLASFIVEGFFNIVELVTIVGSHLIELELH
jgi:hypothetical protein